MIDTNGVAAPPETWARIYEVADREPEATHAEIAAAVGCGRATVWRALQARNVPALMELPIARLTLDAGTQMRPELDIPTVQKYRVLIEEGVEMDPIAVVTDGVSYWPYDGFHRIHVRRFLDLPTVPALVTRGTLRDAIRLACGANGKESLPRDDATRRRALATLLDDPEWGKLSVREIAATAQVSIGLVSRVLAERGESRELPPGLRKIAQIDAESGAPRSRERGRSPNGPPPSPLKAPSPGEDEAPERAPGEDDDAGEPAAPEMEPTDEQWLVGLPLRAKLSGAPLATFDEDALLYRRLEPHRGTFKHHAARLLSKCRRRGAYRFAVELFLKRQHPRHWLACASPEDGGCGGTGDVPLVGQCPKCHGRGFRIN
jgi:hypothetical protein